MYAECMEILKKNERRQTNQLCVNWFAQNRSVHGMGEKTKTLAAPAKIKKKTK